LYRAVDQHRRTCTSTAPPAGSATPCHPDLRPADRAAEVRHNSPTFNAAVIGFVEAHRESDTEKNRLCRPNPYASSVEDWTPMMRRTSRTAGTWLGEPDLAAWVADSPLNLLRGLPDHTAEPRMRAALERYLTHVRAAVERAVPHDAQADLAQGST
jgi:hypothetical protein